MEERGGGTGEGRKDGEGERVRREEWMERGGRIVKERERKSSDGGDGWMEE